MKNIGPKPVGSIGNGSFNRNKAKMLNLYRKKKDLASEIGQHKVLFGLLRRSCLISFHFLLSITNLDPKT